MGLLTDEIGKIIMCHVSSASSAGSGSSNATGVNIQGMETVLFIGVLATGSDSDGGTSDGQVKFYLQYSSNSNAGSDAATSNATMTCTDAVVTFTTANITAGSLATLEVDLSKKNFPDGAGYLFPAIGGDSVSVMRVIAIPNPATRSLPISQTTAAVVANA